ncbi:hypothetical protein ACMD2_21378 [Ananas comosus]|uniref:Uncharacterized protein n=1 Tax=Ananas comosus TaxID=4615 RepID=A0A199VKB2_ANACO|nr:hypothetical protein ACMD2_21378 [Ananas comosus]
MIVIVKNPKNPFYMYCGIVQKDNPASPWVGVGLGPLLGPLRLRHRQCVRAYVTWTQRARKPST